MNSVSHLNIDNSVSTQIPTPILLLLKQMAIDLARRDNIDEVNIFAKLNKNINKMTTQDVDFLVENMNKVYATSAQSKLDENNTDTKFVSFLSNLFK